MMTEMSILCYFAMKCFVINLGVSPLCQIFQHSKNETFQIFPIFGLLETPAELKINLSCTLPCSALNCTVIQWCTLHGSSVLYCTTLYCTIQFCNALYCIVMYWSLMQRMVLSVLLQNGVAVYMCIVSQSRHHFLWNIVFFFLGGGGQ